MENQVSFSVIIPVHNKLPHLDRSITSVLNQTYPHFELILIDDASTDGSEREILKYEDPRIRRYKRTKPGPGGYAARNVGINRAKYDWVCFLDADDEWDTNLLNTIQQSIAEHEQVECVTWGWRNVQAGKSWADRTSIANKECKSRFFTLTDFFNQQHTLWTGAVAFKRRLMLQAGGFPEVGYKRGGDVDTWIRCLSHSQSNLWINQNLASYYLDSVNMVTKQVKMDPNYVFTPLVVKLKQASDPKLATAVRYYQNERIFSAVRAQINNGENINYGLIRRMNLTPDCLGFVARLAYNKLRFGLKSLMKPQLRKVDPQLRREMQVTV